MYAIIIVIVTTALWIGYKLIMASEVKGRKAEISPFRQGGMLETLGTITVTLKEIERKEDEMWFICPLEEEIVIGEHTYDYLKIRAKSDSDNLNRKKAVVAYVLAGHSLKTKPPKFLDWGLVKVL